jgi:putative membrane protein
LDGLFHLPQVERMSPKLKKFIQSWVINTLAVAVAARLVPGIHYQTLPDLIIASLLLGILNAFIRPILLLMALPLLIFTLGLFILVINAVLLYFVGWISQGHFVVESFWSAFWGALIIGVISLLLNTLTGSGNGQVSIRRGRRPPDAGPSGGGNGPVIDV